MFKPLLHCFLYIAITICHLVSDFSVLIPFGYGMISGLYLIDAIMIARKKTDRKKT